MSKRAARGQVIELGGEPRINFLPPEIQNRKDARRRRRALFMLVIAIAVLCGIGYYYAAQYAAERQSALESEQQLSLELLGQQSQYSEAKTLANKVTLTGRGITHMSHNEVNWRSVVMDTTAALPTGVTVSQWTVVGASAIEYPQPTSGLFPLNRVASIDLYVNATSLSTLSAAINKLNAVSSVIDVSFTSAQLNEDVGGYESVITVSFGSDVLEGRYADGWTPGVLPSPQPTTPPAQPETEPDLDETVDEGTEEGTE